MRAGGSNPSQDTIFTMKLLQEIGTLRRAMAFFSITSLALAAQELTPLQKGLLEWDKPTPEKTIGKILKKENVFLNELKPDGIWIKTTETLQEQIPKGTIPEITREAGNWLASEKGITPLHIATLLRNHQAMRVLLENGHPKYPAGKNWGWTPLRIAAENEDITAARILLGIQEDDPATLIRIRLDISSQRLSLEKKENGFWQETFSSPLSSGTAKNPTPTGTFFVSDKHRVRRSNLYHVDMPYFMRLSLSAIGMHQGRLPGYPASHGCIRLPLETAKKLFSEIPVGTEVTIH